MNQTRASEEGAERLVVNEIFGPTIQGEGMSLGVPAVFLRVAGCPLSCSWCDTAYSWDWSRHSRAANTRVASPLEAWDEVTELASGSGARTLVITGGEPASQWRALSSVADLARGANWRVEVETSGAVDLNGLLDLVDQVTVSPKLSSAGMQSDIRIRPQLLRRYNAYDNVVWKFVIDNQEDLHQADEVVREHDLRPVFVMAQATTEAEVLKKTRWLTPLAIQRGYRVTPRLHTLLWGDERGR